MTNFHAFLYGAIQGLSEFLPISSSGHLALLPYFMSIQDPGVLFDLCLHLGTAAAVCCYFRERILGLLRALKPALLDLKQRSLELDFMRNFATATVASVLLILVLKPFATHARGPWVILFNQAFFGIILWVADQVQRRKASSAEAKPFFESDWRWKEAGLIGLAQALAIFPGVSRSGITLSMAFFLGLKRDQAGSFSFLLSLPIIVAGVLVEIPHVKEAVSAGQFEWTPLFLGVLVSFVFGLATIHVFLRLIGKIHLGWFTAYRLALAGVLLVLLTR